MATITLRSSKATALTYAEMDANWNNLNLGQTTNAAITGGTIQGVAFTASQINSTPIGALIPSTGAFTALTSSGASQFATSSGNVLIGTSTDDGINKLQVAGGIVVKTANKLGYTTGAGNSVTQTTSRTTGVTINAPTGSITLVSASGSGSWMSFTVSNNLVTANDVILMSQKSGIDRYRIHVTNVSAGSFEVTFDNTSGATVEQPVFNFAIISGASA